MQSQTKQVLSREHSSVGLEHLPYKQRVGGSTPSAPTKSLSDFLEGFFFVSYLVRPEKGPISWPKVLLSLVSPEKGPLSWPKVVLSSVCPEKGPLSWPKQYLGGLFCNVAKSGADETDEVGWSDFNLHSAHAGADVDGREVKRCGVDEGREALFCSDR